MDTTVVKRKLIDLSAPVFTALTREAQKQGVSLKKYIENLLESEAERRRPAVPAGVTDPRIISLVGIAKGITLSPEDESDERLNYILSK